MTLFVDGLYDTISMVLARYRESVHRLRLTFEILSNFARSKYQAYRAKVQHIKSTFPSSRSQRDSSLQSHMGFGKSVKILRTSVAVRQPSISVNIMDTESADIQTEHADQTTVLDENAIQQYDNTESSQPQSHEGKQHELFYSAGHGR